MLKDLPFGKDVIDSNVESLDDFEKAFILQILNKYRWKNMCDLLIVSQILTTQH